MADVKITFDIDKIDTSDFAWGDLEDLQSGKFAAIRALIERFAIVEGLSENESLTSFLRGLSVPEMTDLVNDLTSVMNEKSNPADQNGKNSIGVLQNTSARVLARRR